VVQPDISVFCSPDILDDAGARGAPDLIVEILSPATSYKDQTHKLALYELHCVREYWIVNDEVLGGREIPVDSFL
jgi:Uma2 family endonuclease